VSSLQELPLCFPPRDSDKSVRTSNEFLHAMILSQFVCFFLCGFPLTPLLLPPSKRRPFLFRFPSTASFWRCLRIVYPGRESLLQYVGWSPGGKVFFVLLRCESTSSLESRPKTIKDSFFGIVKTLRFLYPPVSLSHINARSLPFSSTAIEVISITCSFLPSLALQISLHRHSRRLFFHPPFS